MMFSPILAVALALAPADRLQMADKMFAKGLYSEAAREYQSIRGEKSVSQSDVLFRIAECDHALGREKEAMAAYETLLR
jgi:TolA-binding protein